MDQMVLAEKRENARKYEMKTWASQMIKANQDMMARLWSRVECNMVLVKDDGFQASVSGMVTII